MVLTSVRKVFNLGLKSVDLVTKSVDFLLIVSALASKSVDLGTKSADLGLIVSDLDSKSNDFRTKLANLVARSFTLTAKVCSIVVKVFILGSWF